MSYELTKRLFDVVCASIGIIILAPLGFVISLLIKLSDGGPILYGQIRIGRHSKPFRIWKFRSMVVNAEKLGVLLTKGGDPRITPIGRFIRKTKLDELPQLCNVFVGDMTFVGPRPEVPRYVDHYSPEQREILNYKPGITDLATMLFRDEESLLAGSGDIEGFYLKHCLPKKIELNRQYAHNASLLQDIWIIVQTLCPYWLGVLLLYAAALVAGLCLSYQLRSDFRVTSRDYDELGRCLPWIVSPQLIFLFWRGQLRGLISYFSIREMRLTATALAMAFCVQVGLARFALGPQAPTLSLLLMDLILSFFALCAVRMAVRLLREHSSKRHDNVTERVWRIAIIGTGELATNLALDLSRDRNAGKQVVAFFDDNPRTWRKRPHDIPVIGMPECLLSQDWRNKIDEVVVAMPETEPVRLEEIGTMLRVLPIKVTFASGWPVLKVLSR